MWRQGGASPERLTELLTAVSPLQETNLKVGLLPLFFMQLLLSHMFLSFMVRTSPLKIKLKLNKALNNRVLGKATHRHQQVCFWPDVSTFILRSSSKNSWLVVHNCRTLDRLSYPLRKTLGIKVETSGQKQTCWCL